MKKTIIFLLSFMFLFGLSACNEKQELVWLVADPEFVELRQELLDQYLEEAGVNYTVKLECVTPPMEELEAYSAEDMETLLISSQYDRYTDELLDMQEQNSQADILYIPFLGEGDEYVQYAKLELLEELTPYLEEGDFSVYSGIHEIAWDSLRIDGKIYGIHDSYNGRSTAYAYNNEYLRKIGLEPEDISTDLLENEALFQKVYETEGEDFPIMIMWLHLQEELPFFNVGVSSAIGIDSEGRVVNMYAEDSTLDYLEKFKSLKDKGYLYFPNYEGYEVFDEEHSFFGVTYGSHLLERESVYMEVPDESLSGETRYIDVTAIPESLNNKYGYYPVNFFINGIASWSENKELALSFLDLLYTDEELANLIAYGEVETDYQVEDGRITYAYRSFNHYTNDVITYSIGEQPANKVKAQQLYYDSSSANAVRGFRIDYSEIMDEVEATNAVLYSEEGWFTELGQQIDFLEMDDVSAVLAEVNEKLEEAGIQTVIDEVQRQWDEFRR